MEPQISTIHWFGFFFKQKKVKNDAWYNNVILKLKETKWFIKLYISFTIKQMKFQNYSNILQYNLYIRAPD